MVGKTEKNVKRFKKLMNECLVTEKLQINTCQAGVLIIIVIIAVAVEYGYTKEQCKEIEEKQKTGKELSDGQKALRRYSAVSRVFAPVGFLFTLYLVFNIGRHGLEYWKKKKGTPVANGGGDQVQGSQVQDSGVPGTNDQRRGVQAYYAMDSW